ncbi:helix-turn-helix domain-containing protein [Parapedobacter koreensis]|uniref:Helix-turn-helix domain-containing protein n=1 Tax=Parapedobacter koreensis TaxID=332977 RepID=A0A1H7PWL8_9SPHI|nr:AraC family transcriptional regulator [Parapedobacter koreensis]SEL39956.1 Helix-turn-helix domain-containing protein [Parapedobacter koreensis]
MAPVTSLQTFYQQLHRETEQLSPGAGHFNLFRVEDLELPNSKPVSYSRRDFFKISLVTGDSKIHYADRTVDTHGTVLVFTNPMIPFFWERISKRQTGFVCVFTEAFFARYGQIKDFPAFQGPATGIVQLADDQTGHFQEFFERMYAELHGDYIFKYDLLRNQLLELVHEAQKLQPISGQLVSAANAAERIAGLFAELLERQFPIEMTSQVLRLRSAKDYAQQLHVHVNHLNKALKTITGHTTMQLIAERMMQEARILLKSTDWTIGEISRSLGFEEPNHFSAFFKSKSGQSPNHFRQTQKD